MWSDNEAAVDLLDVKHLVKAVTDIVHGRSLLPATIGVYGDWGSGKSTLLRMIKSELESDSGVHCLSFNGWLFEGYADAKAALMGTILDEIAERRTLGARGKDLIGRLARQVDWMHLGAKFGKNAVALALGGPAALGLSVGSDLVSSLKDLLLKAKETGADAIDDEAVAESVRSALGPDKDLRRNVRDFHKDFSKLLDDTDIETLVVFIDDLDRCAPDTVIETLEAIRLFLFVPRTAFILGADERLVRYAVRRRFPELPGDRTEVGRDYLEKLVQFSIRIPPLGRAEVETYINLLFASLSLTQEQFELARLRAVDRGPTNLSDVTFNYGVAAEVFGSLPVNLADQLFLAERLAPILASGLNGNPRQCKRFLNTLLMRLNMAQSRGVSLQIGVLAKLMLLEYFRPDWFKRLAELQGNEAGRPIQLAVLETLGRPQHGNLPESLDRLSGVTTPSETGGSQEPTLADEFKAWLLDSWYTDWLSLEPSLSGTDLRQYFFFTRDSLGPLNVSSIRLGPGAAEFLRGLLSDSEAEQLVVLKRAAALSPGDASTVFDVLAERIRRQDDLGGNESLLPRAFALVQTRSDLCSQLVSFLTRLPERHLPPVTVVHLIETTQRSEAFSSSVDLLKRWSVSTANPVLASAAKDRLDRLGAAKKSGLR